MYTRQGVGDGGVGMVGMGMVEVGDGGVKFSLSTCESLKMLVKYRLGKSD